MITSPFVEIESKEEIITKSKSSSLSIAYSAEGGSRTRTPFARHRILSPTRKRIQTAIGKYLLRTISFFDSYDQKYDHVQSLIINEGTIPKYIKQAYTLKHNFIQ